MDQVDQVKKALNANSRTTTVDELKASGRTKVRVVKAEQIAAMIAEAVQRAVGGSGSLSKAEHEKLVERSRDEFKAVIKQREAALLEVRRAAASISGRVRSAVVSVKTPGVQPTRMPRALAASRSM